VERHNSTYGDWMAPAAGVAAAGGLGAAAYQHQHQGQQQQQHQHPLGTSEITTMGTAPTMSTHPPIPPNTVTEMPTHSTPEAAVNKDNSFLARDEAVPSAAASSEVANGGSGSGSGSVMHPTGHIFPSVMRHDTDISVSDLHVPGEYP
jgi:hypothetical protein